jgi:hypothetical protein
MTDPLTDAVRRIKQLQNDVERLKSAENEEGEPRLFFNTQERAVATETIKIGPDETQSEIAVATETIKIGPDEVQFETATADDKQADLRKQRQISASVDEGRYSTSLYNSTTYQ